MGGRLCCFVIRGMELSSVWLGGAARRSNQSSAESRKPDRKPANQTTYHRYGLMSNVFCSTGKSNGLKHRI